MVTRKQAMTNSACSTIVRPVWLQIAPVIMQSETIIMHSDNESRSVNRNGHQGSIDLQSFDDYISREKERGSGVVSEKDRQ